MSFPQRWSEGEVNHAGTHNKHKYPILSPVFETEWHLYLDLDKRTCPQKSFSIALLGKKNRLVLANVLCWLDGILLKLEIELEGRKQHISNIWILVTPEIKDYLLQNNSSQMWFSIDGNLLH